MNNEITLGQLISFVTLSGYFLGPFSRMLNLQHTLQECLISSERFCEILDIDGDCGGYNLTFAFISGIISARDIKKKIQMGSSDFSAALALKTTKIPVLFIHGTDDHFVPISMTYENYKACASPKKLLVIPGADHAMSFFIDSEQYKKTVLDFWAEFDKYEYMSLKDSEII